MSRDPISTKLLNAVREAAKDDKPVGNFLIQMMVEESRRPEHWQYKEFYLKSIRNHLEVWSIRHENQEDSA